MGIFVPTKFIKEYTLKIRQVMPHDAPLIARLNTTVQQLHYELEPVRYKAPDPDVPMLRQLYEQWLRRSDCVAFLAQIDRQPVGYIICFVQEPTANPFVNAVKSLRIDQISVDVAYQRQGIGRALMEAAYETAQQHEVAEVTLGVHIYNENAQQFFKAMGFAPGHLRMRSTM